jgi:anti-sigma factor RsiW
MTPGPEMTMKYSRDDLLKELEATIDLAGAKTRCWSDERRARLCAFIEGDQEAARLFAEARALDEVLTRAPQGRFPAGFEAKIIDQTVELLQDQSEAPVKRIVLRDYGDKASAAKPAQFRSTRPVWGSVALLAASLTLGIYIGVSGEAVPALRSIELLASNDADMGIAFSGSLFAPSDLQDGQL